MATSTSTTTTTTSTSTSTTPPYWYKDGWIVFDNDFNKLLKAHMNNGVLLGLSISALSSPSFGVKVESGAFVVDNKPRRKVGSTNVTLDSAETDPRKDLIIINADGEITKVSGVAQAAEPTGKEGAETSRPKPPDIPDGAIVLAEVWVAAGATEITDADIIDRRVFVKDPLYDLVQYIAAFARWKIKHEIRRFDAMTEQWYFYEDAGTYYVKDQNNVTKASGTDPVTVWNDGVSLLSAAGGGCLEVRDIKVYEFDTSTTPLKQYDNVKVNGEYGYDTVLKLKSNSDNIFIQNEDQTNGNTFILFENIAIDHNRQGQSVKNATCYFKSVGDVYFYKVKFLNNHKYAIHFFDTGYGNNRLYFVGCEVEGYGTGSGYLYFQGYDNDVPTDRVYVVDSKFRDCEKLGAMYLSRALICNNEIMTSHLGFTTRGARECIIALNTIDNVTETTQDGGIYIRSTSANKVENVLVYRNELKDCGYRGIYTEGSYCRRFAAVLNRIRNSGDKDIYITTEEAEDALEFLNVVDSYTNIEVASGKAEHPVIRSAVKQAFSLLGFEKHAHLEHQIVRPTCFVEYDISGAPTVEVVSREVQDGVMFGDAWHVTGIDGTDYVKYRAVFKLPLTFKRFHLEAIKLHAQRTISGATLTVKVFNPDGTQEAVTKTKDTLGVDELVFKESDLTLSYEPGERFYVQLEVTSTSTASHIHVTDIEIIYMVSEEPA